MRYSLLQEHLCLTFSFANYKPYAVLPVQFITAYSVFSDQPSVHPVVLYGINYDTNPCVSLM